MIKKMDKTKTRTKKASPKDCYFTQTNTVPNYKDVLVLKRFLSERGKILPASVSGISARHQRALSTEVKKARFMALMSYTDRHAL
jgi:small subunit ribosomal protein S18